MDGRNKGAERQYQSGTACVSRRRGISLKFPHLHFCYKSKDLEHFCLRGGRQKEGKRGKSVSKRGKERERK